MARPRKAPQARHQVLATIDQACRQHFLELGLRDGQVEDAVNYVRRGYTKNAAARLSLAGGRSSTLVQ